MHAIPTGASAATAPRAEASPSLDRIGGQTMGTTWSVVLAAPAHRAADDAGRALHRLHARAQGVLDGVVSQMSHWDADSDLSRYNRAAPGWVRLPDALLEVLDCALDIARASGGAFDPTLGELAARWGFGPAGAVAAPPSRTEVDAARARAGWQRLSLDRAHGMALQPGGLQLDLSAIAKGHAVDRVADALQAAGVRAMLVEVGGELRGIGRKPDGTPWRVLVETAYEQDAAADASPAETDAGAATRDAGGGDAPDVLALDDVAVATSGDRWHRYRHGGTDYAHTLDPRTGAPLARAPMAATVVAGDAMRADAWATALSVVDRDTALALAARAGVGLRLVERIDERLRITRTPAFERHLA